jgi:endoplasmic reticulum resident protein 44
MSAKYFLIVALISPVIFCESDVTQLTSSIKEELMHKNQLLFVNFYADWCRFSQMLAPVFEESAKQFFSANPLERGRVSWAKVDCDRESALCQEFRISKYPTLKFVLFGEPLRKEYRGQRTNEALVQSVRDLLRDVLIVHPDNELLVDAQLEKEKRYIVGQYKSKEAAGLNTLKVLAHYYKEECTFHVLIRPDADEGVRFILPQTETNDPFVGDSSNRDLLNTWLLSKCVPFVREITFENAEELTEEGLPFLILFYNPSDGDEIKKRFKDACTRELQSERYRINFLTADGNRFAHPLHHLGKSVNDLPLLAIDSFKHMFVFPHDLRTKLDTPGLLKQFVEDLHSGKLHREFHYGPDPTTQAAQTQPSAVESQPPSQKETSDHVPRSAETAREDTAEPPVEHQPHTGPVESVFKHLQPSENRYTILSRDEL